MKFCSASQSKIRSKGVFPDGRITVCTHFGNRVQIRLTHKLTRISREKCALAEVFFLKMGQAWRNVHIIFNEHHTLLVRLGWRTITAH